MKSRAPVLRRLSPLYPVASAPSGALETVQKQVHWILETGLRFFQVRAKGWPDKTLYSILLEVRERCYHYNAAFIVNDRIDLALATGAAGVHLGQTDLPIHAARDLLGDTRIIGLSTHSLEEFREAQSLPVDYVAIGPIFATTSKSKPDPAIGVSAARGWLQESRKPAVAIGGIDLQRAKELWTVGFSSVAVISDLWDRDHPGTRIKEYIEASQS